MDDNRLDEAEIELLEQTIFKARNYVVASDELRPRLVDEAKERSRVQTIGRRLSIGTLACIAVWSISVPIYHGLGVFRDSFSGPFPAEVEQRALDMSYRKHSSHWSMVDAFTQMRPYNLPVAEERPVVGVAPTQVATPRQPAPQTVGPPQESRSKSLSDDVSLQSEVAPDPSDP